MRLRHLAVGMLLCCALSLSTAQWRSSFDSPGAAEQLRLGIVSYHKGRYSEALFLFEKALAYAPGESLILYWLGRAYYKTGYEATALRAWEPLLERPGAPPTLRSDVEALRASRSFGSDSRPERYVETARFEGIIGKERYFLRPSSLVANPDGTVLVAAHGSNEILRMDANGLIIERMRGGVRGLDRPFGLTGLMDGSLFASEYNGDRIRRLDTGEAPAFGSKGRGEGQLLGPQFLASDSDGYIYVSDYGNAQVRKFDVEGRFILSFGVKSGSFPGFVSPTGIAVLNGIVYVADSYRRTLYSFDASGNYLGSLLEGLLVNPEGLAFWKGNKALLIADTRRVLSLDLESEELVELYRSPDKRSRLIHAAPDHNGNLLVADFDASAVIVLTEAPSLAAGYDVEIERIDAAAFPQVDLDLNVRDRFGSPVVGLGAKNFYLSERVRKSTLSEELGKPVLKTEESVIPAEEFQFLGSGTHTRDHRVLLLAESSPAMAEYSEAARSVVTELGRYMGEGSSLGLAVAGKSPSLIEPPSPRPNFKAMLRELSIAGAETGRFDLGLRLAATSLFPSGIRDSIVYLGTGSIDEASFSATTLSEIAALLKNNGIRFYAVLLEEGNVSPSLRYLAERTGGGLYSASRPRGLGDLAAELRGAASGRYRLRFNSIADSGFGRTLLSVSVEAYLYKKSGRDEIGYYAPLR